MDTSRRILSLRAALGVPFGIVSSSLGPLWKHLGFDFGVNLESLEDSFAGVWESILDLWRAILGTEIEEIVKLGFGDDFLSILNFLEASKQKHS